MRKPAALLIAAALLLAPTALAQKTSTTPSSATTMPTKTMPTKTTPAAAPTKSAGTMAKVNINTATAADLAKLPGVSAKIAADIIKNRPYKTEADVVAKVKGIGSKNVKKMSSMLSY